LEQQVLERALQPRHLLREPLAVVLLRRALGLRHVIEEIDRAQYRREHEQDERHRQLERRRETEFHFGSVSSGAGARSFSICRSLFSSFDSSISAISRRPVTASSGAAPPS